MPLLYLMTISFTEHCHGERISQPDIQAKRSLITASVLCLIFMLGEIVGNVTSHSISLHTLKMKPIHFYRWIYGQQFGNCYRCCPPFDRFCIFHDIIVQSVASHKTSHEVYEFWMVQSRGIVKCKQTPAHVNTFLKMIAFFRLSVP